MKRVCSVDRLERHPIKNESRGQRDHSCRSVHNTTARWTSSAGSTSVHQSVRCKLVGSDFLLSPTIQSLRQPGSSCKDPQPSSCPIHGRMRLGIYDDETQMSWRTTSSLPSRKGGTSSPCSIYFVSRRLPHVLHRITCSHYLFSDLPVFSLKSFQRIFRPHRLAYRR